MTIRKGQEWATPATETMIEVAKIVRSDSELATEALRAWESDTVFFAQPGQGDVLKTLGLTSARRNSEAMVYPWDLGIAEFHIGDSVRRVPFVAHVVIGSRFGHRRSICVMNAPWYGRYRLGPKAHPNDGLVDVTDGTLPVRQFLLARRRAVTGTHLPHPALSTARVADWDMSFDRNMVALVDGVRMKAVERAIISLIPDAFSIVA